MNLQDLQNPKIYALLAGAGAGALLAPKKEEIPQGASEEALALLTVLGVITPLAMAHYAPAHPLMIGAISGIAGALGVAQSGANLGNVASLLIGGSLLWGSPSLKNYAVLGLMGIGGLSLGSGALTVSRQRENLLAAKNVAPIMPPPSAASPPAAK